MPNIPVGVGCLRLALAIEFQTLATEEPLDLLRIRDFMSRLRQHIVDHRLKGFEPFIWDVEALEYLAVGNSGFD